MTLKRDLGPWRGNWGLDKPGAAAASRSRCTIVSSKAPRTGAWALLLVPYVREERERKSTDPTFGKCPKPQDVFHTSFWKYSTFQKITQDSLSTLTLPQHCKCHMDANVMEQGPLKWMSVVPLTFVGRQINPFKKYVHPVIFLWDGNLSPCLPQRKEKSWVLSLAL